MKAILITPNHETRRLEVTTVELESDPAYGADLKSIYQHVGCSEIEMIDCDPHGPLAGHSAVLDENGLYALNLGYSWVPQIGHQPYAGRILLVGLNAMGETIDATVDENTVRQLPGMVYLLPRTAVVFASRHESIFREEYPGVIMVPASHAILEQIAAQAHRQAV